MEEYRSWNNEITKEKTQHMAVECEEVAIIKTTETYQYLENTFTKNDRVEKDITQKIGRGSKTTSRIYSNILDKNISKDIKIRIFEPISCVTYTSDIWTMDKRIQDRVQPV